jgi:nucleotide-binding universal stress UspA family protein
MDKFPPALAFAKLFKARVHIVGLLLPGERVIEKNMRTLCTVIEKRFSANGVKVKTVLASSQQPADAIIRYAQSQAGSLVVINQDYDFRLVELFRGTFTKRILHKILSPVLIVPR